MRKFDSVNAAVGFSQSHTQLNLRLGHWLAIGALLVTAFFLCADGSFASEEVESAARQWFVAIGGDDALGRGTTTAPLRTMQYAIDQAQDGDVVVVLPGVYTGPGNENLTLGGKRITIRSENPSDPVIIGQTIIQATETAVIARFTHNEGPQTIFEGFTLRGGSKAPASGRGVSGYFTFSNKARPTIRRVAVERSEDRATAVVPQFPLMAPMPYSSARAWDGFNPFHQPSRSSDYLGSGDVNNDGHFDGADATALEGILQGSDSPDARADVDGNGAVNRTDLDLLEAGLTGAKLPGWWNALDSREQRMAWLEKVIADDETEQHPYFYWFQCLDFAAQFLIRTTGYRNDLSDTFYDGYETLYNLPVYIAVIIGDSFGHAINAILVGDDPLNFSDWYFFEPQTDEAVRPGMWDMPYNVDIYIQAPLIIHRGANGSAGNMVEFHVDATGEAVFVANNPELISQRPSQVPVSIKTERHRWRSDLFSYDGGSYLIYEAVEESLSRHRRLHVAELPLTLDEQSISLATGGTYTDLLDVATDDNGTVHLLWESDAEYIPGVFYAQLDMSTKELLHEQRLSEGERQIAIGRLLVTATGEVHAFWLDTRSNTFDAFEPGVYWAYKTNEGWSSAENLTPQLYEHAYLGWDDNEWFPRSMRAVFDVAQAGNGSIVMVWLDPIDLDTSNVKTRVFSSFWGTASTLYDSRDGRALTLATDTDGRVHLVYAYQQQGDYYARFGTMIHTVYQEGQWSTGRPVGGSDPGGYPYLAGGEDGTLALVWSRQSSESGAVVPVWSIYDGATWSVAWELAVSNGADAWYPRALWMANDQLVINWNEHTPEFVTIKSRQIEPLNMHYLFLPLMRNGD